MGVPLQDLTPSSGDPSAMQALLLVVRDSLHIQDASSSPSQNEVSFCRNICQPLGFPNHRDFEQLVSKEWKHLDRRLHASKKFDVLFPYPVDLVSR